MKHEIKFTIEYDGHKVEHTVPVGNLYKVDWETAYFRLLPEDECSYILHDHLLFSLLSDRDRSQACRHEQNIPHFQKLREMCKELCLKVKDKLRSL